MKVTDVKTFVVDCFRTNWVFVKVYTDEGLTGVGEATLEYKEKALTGAVEHIRAYLVGQNPLDVEKHYHNIYRDAYWRGGAVLMSALSAVETALWDLLGKFLGVPVYQRLDSPADTATRSRVKALTADDVALKDLGGSPVTQVLTHAPGNNAAIGGLKVVSKDGWFAVRPSGTEDICKLYAESFKGKEHLKCIQDTAQDFLQKLLG